MNTLRLQLRFLLPLFALLLLAAYITVPLVDSLTQRWFMRDLSIRAKQIADTSSSAIASSGAPLDSGRISAELQKELRDDRLLALAICSPQDEVSIRTQGFPAELSCAAARLTAQKEFPVVNRSQGGMHIAFLPLHVDLLPDSNLVVLQEVSFIERRSASTRQYLLILFLTLGSAIALITMIVAHLSWRGWLQGTRALLRGESLLRTFQPPPEFQGVASDLRAMLRELEDSQRARMHATGWDPDRLRQVIANEMRGEQVIVVSNREPYIHSKTEDGIRVHRPASGLVTAIEPVMRACSGTWIAHGSGNADRDTVDSQDRVPVPPESPSYTLRRVWMSEEEEKGYYYGFANEGMWPLCHLAHVRPVFRLSDWEHYKIINQRFADAVVREARAEDPIVLVQDYHFALLPALLRKRLPNATIITFWHIPWPNPESFGVCPWHEEILRGMLGSSILGFHTRFHCRNFLESADRFLEARIRLEESTITLEGDLTQVNSYPISIHWPTPEEIASWPSVQECRHRLRQLIGVEDEYLIAVGVDRFDYTKGIIERFHAVDRLLDKHPDLRRRYSFVQFAAPTRSALDEYQIFVEQVTRLAERINLRYGDAQWKPIHLIAEHQESDEVIRHYRGADCCVVTSLHDGMNLVAKEFIAARDDLQGTLVLSQFTGAARELDMALIVNPYDVENTADAMYRALTMSAAEQKDRMRSLRAGVMEDNVYRWAASMLLDAARLRRSERISARITAREER